LTAEKGGFCALIISRSADAAEKLRPILRGSRFARILTADSAGQARRLAAEHSIDVAVINAPLRDDDGLQLAVSLAERNISVLVLTGRDAYDMVAYKLESCGAFVLPKPLQRGAMVQALHMLKAMRVKLTKLEEKNASLEDKMKEIRMVNRAKWLLIARLSMTEEEAHRYIEKEAMDACVRKREIAEKIISLYDG
jgi:response regulator NasT